VIVTEWDEFRQVNWDRIRSVVERPLVVDGRNMLDSQEMARRGFHYISIGRPPIMPSTPLTGDDQPRTCVQDQLENVFAGGLKS
jgi:hypothetical protein